MSVTSSSKTLLSSPGFQALVRRLGTSLVILLVIAYLTLFGLTVAERGRRGLPARPLGAAVETLTQTADYVINHPETYHWHKQDLSASNLVLTLFGRSAALLLVALGIATLLGVPLGIAVALFRRVSAAPLVLLVSVLGVSTPSFLLAMLFWVINIRVYQSLGLDKAILPQVGFGWDAHLVMPVLVLATRPLAQIMQVTYVSMSSVLEEDYIRVARAKGLIQRIVVNRHALRNILIPVLTTLGTSLRFSLASLPVVEFFFYWPGVGLTLLQAAEAVSPLVTDLVVSGDRAIIMAINKSTGLSLLVTDLIVSLGFLFLLINLVLEVIYQVIDPRLRGSDQTEVQVEERRTWRERISDFGFRISDLGFTILRLRFHRTAVAAGQVSDLRLKRLPGLRRQRATSNEQPATSNQQPATSNQQPATSPKRPAWHTFRSIVGNPALIVGTLLVLSFFGLAFWGERLGEANPYETHGVMIIDGQIAAPPFRPSNSLWPFSSPEEGTEGLFPWGSDPVGRDVLALVLAGAKQTLALALAGMIARVLLGAFLGVLAGWWQRSWLDRLITGAIAVWAAFPVTLFAMIVILALGIQQGMKIFVVALCVVGWGEIAQFVRGQVLGIKPQLYIEAARAVGARPSRILSWHVLPHLLAPLLVLAVLEMGGVLMLLAELGFLNIFLGGGFRVELMSGIFFFSDVPEWGALLANIHRWWRGYPWMAWYPGLAFFIAILAFNLWGEGLRRLLDETRINVSRLVNRYSVVTIGVLVLGLGWVVRSSAPVELYSPQAEQFDAQRAMEDIRTLASPRFQGRETGTPDARQAADYIAGRMEEIGLFPAGRKGTYIQSLLAYRFHMTEIPRLEILNEQGQVAEALAYRQDFVEYIGFALTYGEGEGEIVALAFGPDPELPGRDPYRISNLNLYDKILLVREADARYTNFQAAAGVLVVNDGDDESDDAFLFERRYLIPRIDSQGYVPVMYITSQVAERLLATAGSSLSQLDELAEGLEVGQVACTSEGAKVRLVIEGELAPDDKYHHVIGFIPGTGAMMGEEMGEGLDSKVIMISANYDGLGTSPDGTFYPGANDNASGVAAMLEMARVLKESPYQPQKTIVFVAWTGGERSDSLSVSNVMNAKPGFGLLTVEAVIELSGVGAGSGEGIALGQGTSFRLVQLFQESASRLGVSVTTRGRDPHFGLPSITAFGGRSALSAFVSWDGSDKTAHTPGDTPETIDPDKLKQVGQTVLLVVNVLGQAEAQESPSGPLTTADDYLQGARMFDEEQAMEYIEYLADDELSGRRPGTPGGQAAGDYIANRFAEYGLQPAGSDGTYFQPFTHPYTTVVEPPVLAVTLPAGEMGSQAILSRTYTYLTDYVPRIRNYAGSGEVEGQVVWLNECRTKDFSGQEVAGKVLLCTSPPYSASSLYDQMVEQALESQAGGILLIVDGNDPFARPSYRTPITGMVNLPAFYITEAVAQDLLAGTDYTLGKLEQRTVATPLSITAHIAAAFEVHEVKPRNVLGLLPGSDPDHKDEFVIVGAHYDHMGRDPDGSIFNGANDNASGTAVVLEIARLWQAQGFRPARSVLFAAWDDEEHGLLGAKHYAENPSYPLDHTVAVLNLDMVGVGDEPHINGWREMVTQLEASAEVYSITTALEPGIWGSDHVAFQAAGIPAAMLMMYYEHDRVDPLYHKTSDDVENIQPGSLRTAGVLSVHTLAAWSGGGPTLPLPDTGPKRILRDLILPTPTCAPPWPTGSMTCDHGKWSR